ncbi:MAG: hypothetical protein UY70_C0019G0005 [Candidatus Kaiserbacteria bacterium GW2011_GWB1_52_6]|uniref:Uncharacterized protein n=3 Tax=Candidatus Kaiseribacteriota TaxID=1752734 RepID=A0A0G2AD20_9BACT|nr:MAG: hypothetical protein UY67_C0027G0005 [Candidatus Kaiserbacteria bacterium GW2011_GWA2_52_12]KKW27010.1 MAG: hypothetical protein UY70_C0019G0005 [Candidatus Kaiserbacteria bacterium GW2011_GWB1_52_6]KKW30334.1 MAG: hypothetical protein UY74_C0044G0012 [Candidatus Kaiserbacteria bacterium GW2011_GWC2_52_8b]
MDQVTDTDEPIGYTPRKYTIFEEQIEDSWLFDTEDVNRLITDWVGNATPGPRFRILRMTKEDVVEAMKAHVLNCYERDLSPFAGVAELRLIMEERGLNS